MTKENLRQQIEIHLENLGIFEIVFKKNISFKRFEKILNEFKKKNWINDNYKQNMIYILCDNLDLLKSKSIIILNQVHVN